MILRTRTLVPITGWTFFSSDKKVRERARDGVHGREILCGGNSKGCQSSKRPQERTVERIDHTTYAQTLSLALQLAFDRVRGKKGMGTHHGPPCCNCAQECSRSTPRFIDSRRIPSFHHPNFPVLFRPLPMSTPASVSGMISHVQAPGDFVLSPFVSYLILRGRFQPNFD